MSDLLSNIDSPQPNPIMSDTSMVSEPVIEAQSPSTTTTTTTNITDNNTNNNNNNNNNHPDPLQEQPLSGVTTTNLPTDQPEEKPRVVATASPALLEDSQFIKLLATDSAVETLLTRLKKSILTCEEFAKYIRKKAVTEQEHEEHLRKISRTTQEIFKTNGNLKSDSFSFNFDKLVKLDDRVASQNSAYSKQLSLMYEELNVLASTITRTRKGHKDNFKRKEKEVVDSISAAEKAKQKYDSLCLELERVKTTDPSKKTLTLRGSKTTSEQEEILHRKIEAAETDYRQKVTSSTGLRNVFLDSFRPNLVKQLKDIVIEIDIAMSVQLQKYSTKTEDLILQTALSVNPLKGSNLQSMKVTASCIDNERDLYQYVLKNSNESRNKSLLPVEFRQHPSIITSTFSSSSTAAFKSSMKPIPNSQSNSNNNNSNKSIPQSTPFNQSVNSSNSYKPSSQSQPSSSFLDPASASYNSGMSPPLNSTHSNNNRPLSMISSNSIPSQSAGGNSSTFKTFGTSIQQLNELEGDLVPSFVRQCIYVVDKYGINLEGIYRTSGNMATVNTLKDAIDRDPRNIKMLLPNPNSVTDSDIYAVSSLLKSFFSQLPEALLTEEATPILLAHGRINEDDIRVKKLHELIFTLPDASYWTLRSLILHLHRIASNNTVNLMTARNLSIVWAPTLFPKVTSGSFNAEDMTCQGRVIEDLITRANDFFDPE